MIEITVKFDDTELTRRYVWEESILPEVWGERVQNMVDSISNSKSPL